MKTGNSQVIGPPIIHDTHPGSVRATNAQHSDDFLGCESRTRRTSFAPQNCRFRLWGALCRTFVFVGIACLPLIQVIRSGPSPVAMFLCGSMALGASIGIIANARDPFLSVDRKVMKCGMLTALVWGILTIPGLMLIGAAKMLNG